MTRILIAEPSYLLRKGLLHIINQLQYATEVEIVGSHLGLMEVLRHFSPDVIIINEAMTITVPMEEIKRHLPDPFKVIHLINAPVAPDSKSQQISIYDSKMVLMDKLGHFLKADEEKQSNEESEELTTREKLVLKHVALGQTNKEIASALFISTHTVISHRKNITRKLDIKSVSGLTVYAILNGIIKMEDIA